MFALIGKLIDELFKGLFLGLSCIVLLVVTGGNWIFWLLIAAYVLRPFYDKSCRSSI